jgi:diphosphomevalonate decarboxylase
MMTSQPSFVLMQPNSLAVMAAVKRFRNEHKVPVCFTLDAGPNLHLLYPDDVREQVLQFINESLLPYTHDRQWIDDHVGEGPSRLF